MDNIVKEETNNNKKKKNVHLHETCTHKENINTKIGNEKKKVMAEERKTSYNKVSPKIEFNPSLHSLIKNNSSKTKHRLEKRDKQKKQKRKRVVKEKSYVRDYNDLINTSLDKEFHTTKSPHLLLNNKWFQKIKNNVVMLKCAKEVSINSKRMIHYNIDFFGDKVDYIRKGNLWILNPNNTPTNSIYVIIRLQDIFHIEKVQYHTESGEMISKFDLDINRDHCYVLLSLIHTKKNSINSSSLVDEKEITLMNRFLRNQILQTNGNYHFKTTGTIYGMGYGPKSNRNEYGHSVCRFANGEYISLNYFFSYQFLRTHYLTLIHFR